MDEKIKINKINLRHCKYRLIRKIKEEFLWQMSL